MLIKLFDVAQPLRTAALQEAIIGAVATKLQIDPDTIRVRYSDTRTTSAPVIRAVVTGLDAFRRERTIIASVGYACETYFSSVSIEWPGISNPALPGQP